MPNYTPSDQIRLQQEMSQQLMNKPMRSGVKQGVSTDWGRGLAHMLNQYQGGKMRRDASQQQADNAAISSDEISKVLGAIGSDGSTPDFSNMAISQGVDPSVVQGAQSSALPSETLQSMSVQSPQAQALRVKLLGDELSHKRGMSKQDALLTGQAENQQTLAGINNTSRFNVNDASIRARAEQNALNRESTTSDIGVRGEEARQTAADAPYNLPDGGARYQGLNPVPISERTKTFAPLGDTTQGRGFSTLVKDYLESEATVEKSKGRLETVGRLRELNKSGRLQDFTGAFAPVFTAAMSGMSSFGFRDEMLTDAQMFQSWVAGLKTEELKEGGRGLTDEDMKIVSDSFPKLATDANAREAILNVLEKQQYSAIESFDANRKRMMKNQPDYVAEMPWLDNALNSPQYKSYLSLRNGTDGGSGVSLDRQAELLERYNDL